MTELTKTTKVLFICLANLSLGIGVSIFAPFFPSKAKENGISEYNIGLIIAQYQISSLIFALILTKMMGSLISPTTGLKTGLFASGIGITLIGFVDLSSSGVPYLMVCRTIHGMGDVTITISVWTILMTSYPDSISKLLATTEMVLTLGSILGPSIGAAIYEFGDKYSNFGFSLTFRSFGSFILITAFVMLFVFKDKSMGKSKLERVNLLSLFKNKGYSLCVLNSMFCSVMFGFNDSTLDLHIMSIRKVSLFAKSSIFLLFGLVAAIGNQLFAFIADKMTDCYILILIGQVATMACFIIIGPVPFIHIEPNLTLVILGLILLALGLSAQFVCSFTQGYREIVKSGSDDLSYISALNGVTIISSSIGGFIGSAIGGYLTTGFGYRWATVPLIHIQILITICLLTFLMFGKNDDKKEQ